MQLRLASDAYFIHRYHAARSISSPLYRYGFWILCLLNAGLLFYLQAWLSHEPSAPSASSQPPQFPQVTHLPDVFPPPSAAWYVFLHPPDKLMQPFPNAAHKPLPSNVALDLAFSRPEQITKNPQFIAAQAKLNPNVEPEDKPDQPSNAPAEITPSADIPSSNESITHWLQRLKKTANPKTVEQELIKKIKMLSSKQQAEQWHHFFEATVRYGQHLASYSKFTGDNSVNRLAEYLRQLNTPQANQARSALIDAVAAHGWTQIHAHKYTTPHNDNAYTTLQAVLALHPNHVKAKQGIARIGRKYLYLGKDYLDKGEAERALFMFEKGLSVSPDNSELQQLRDEIHAQLTDPAVILLQRAQAQMSAEKWITPPNDNAYQTFLDILKRHPDHEKAMQGVRKVIDALYAKALTEKKLGNLQASWLLVNSALSHFPNHQKFYELQQELRSITKSEQASASNAE